MTLQTQDRTGQVWCVRDRSHPNPAVCWLVVGGPNRRGDAFAHDVLILFDTTKYSVSGQVTTRFEHFSMKAGRPHLLDWDEDTNLTRIV